MEQNNLSKEQKEAVEYSVEKISSIIENLKENILLANSKLMHIDFEKNNKTIIGCLFDQDIDMDKPCMGEYKISLNHEDLMLLKNFPVYYKKKYRQRCEFLTLALLNYVVAYDGYKYVEDEDVIDVVLETLIKQRGLDKIFNIINLTQQGLIDILYNSTLGIAYGIREAALEDLRSNFPNETIYLLSIDLDKDYVTINYTTDTNLKERQEAKEAILSIFNM